MTTEYKIIFDGQEQTVSLTPDGDSFIINLDSTTHRFDVLLGKSPIYSFLVDGHQVFEAEVNFQKDQCHINVGHVPYRVEIFDPRRRLVSQTEAGGVSSGSAIIEAPMPGKVVDVKIKVGDKVSMGQAVVVVEAMKMQNELASPMDGIVKEIKVSAGDTVESGKPLVVISKA